MEIQAIKGFLVTIDGPSASGKTTLTKILSKKLDFDYLLTGNLFRYVALQCLQNEDLSPEDASNPDILHQASEFVHLYNNATVSTKAAEIALIPEVRKNIEKYERQWVKKSSKKGMIIEGRDIGTVVFPNAHCKIFLTANSSTRLHRERLRNVDDTKDSHIIRQLKERDRLDHNRSISPLRQAPDAYIINNSSLSLSKTTRLAMDIISEKHILYQEVK